MNSYLCDLKLAIFSKILYMAIDVVLRCMEATVYMCHTEMAPMLKINDATIISSTGK